jgi:hypothetical protein
MYSRFCENARGPSLKEMSCKAFLPLLHFAATFAAAFRLIFLT